MTSSRPHRIMTTGCESHYSLCSQCRDNAIRIQYCNNFVQVTVLQRVQDCDRFVSLSHIQKHFLQSRFTFPLSKSHATGKRIAVVAMSIRSDVSIIVSHYNLSIQTTNASLPKLSKILSDTYTFPSSVIMVFLLCTTMKTRKGVSESTFLRGFNINGMSNMYEEAVCEKYGVTSNVQCQNEP